MPPNDDDQRRGILEQMALAAGVAYANQGSLQNRVGSGAAWWADQAYAQQVSQDVWRANQLSARWWANHLANQRPMTATGIGEVFRNINREPVQRLAPEAKPPEPPRPPPIPRYERLMGPDLFGDDE